MKRLLFAGLLAGWFACNPTYDSGKTRCSTSGKCPSSMVCTAANVCVRASDVGAGAGGGSGGSGGSVMCTPLSADDVCTGCTKASCCGQLSTCIANSDCVGLLQCISECATTDCEATCEATFPSGITAVSGVVTCIDSRCTAACGTGATGGTTGTAKIKFCHNLTSGGTPLTLTLDINGTKLTATAGQCTPVTSCLDLPAGTDVPVTLLNGTTSLSAGTLDITAGDELFIQGNVDDGGSTYWESNLANGICSGGSGTTGTLGKFCNFLQKGDQDFLLTLNLGSASFSAWSGTCTPVGSCTTIPAGTAIALSLMDGGSSVTSGTYPSVTAGANMLFRAAMDDTDDTPTVFGAPYTTGLCSVASGAKANRVGSPLVTAIGVDGITPVEVAMTRATRAPSGRYRATARR